MLRSVQRGPRDLRHARVELGEEVAVGSCTHDVHAGGDDGAGIGHEQGAGLDLEVERASIALAKGLDLAPHVRADIRQIHRRLLRHAPDLEAAPQVDAPDLGQLRHEVEGHPGAALPDFRIRARPDVRVEAVDAQAVPLGQGLDLSQVLVPDPEARGGAAGVRALGRAATQPRVHAHRDLTPPRDTPELVQLMQRAGVEEHTAGDVRGEGE